MGALYQLAGLAMLFWPLGTPYVKRQNPQNIEPKHTLPQTLDAPNQKSGSAALKLTSTGPTYSIVVAVGSILAPFVVSPDQWGPFFGI